MKSGKSKIVITEETIIPDNEEEAVVSEKEISGISSQDKTAESVFYKLNPLIRSRVISRVFPLAVMLAVILTLAVSPAYAVRIKDIAGINGVRTNQLVGYGLVVGLNGTGDKSNTLFTNQSMANMLDTMGVKIDPRATKVNNIASVMVTADLPAFAKIGNKFDVNVASMGDAKSIEGGVLLLTQLKGADGEIYAVAQGAIVIGGFLASGQGATVQKNHPTVGRIANGASIEREISYGHLASDNLMITLKEPDFTTSKRVADRINESFRGSAYPKDGGTVTVAIPQDMRANPVKFLSLVENLDVKPDGTAKIIVDEKTGTIVIGENVRIAAVAVSHSNLSVQIKESANVSQPLPFAKGETVVTPETSIKVEEEKGKWFYVEDGITVKELIKGLNAAGASTRDIITILQTIKASGALHAELEVI